MQNNLLCIIVYYYIGTYMPKYLRFAKGGNVVEDYFENGSEPTKITSTQSMMLSKRFKAKINCILLLETPLHT